MKTRLKTRSLVLRVLDVRDPRKDPIMTLAQELAALPRTSFRDLQARYAELFGETTQTRNKAWLLKRIAWRLQANAEGDLSERCQQRIVELANDADLRIMPPRNKPAVSRHSIPVAASRDTTGRRLPMPGTILTRPYKGQTLRVTVLEKGFEYEGVIYRTLSAAAKAITGSHCNGYQFFRLGEWS